VDWFSIKEQGKFIGNSPVNETAVDGNLIPGQSRQDTIQRKFSLSPSAPEHLSQVKLVITWRGIMPKIQVLDNEISIYKLNDEDYICITDIARYKDPDRTDYIIQNWLRNRNTIEFLGIWERLNNPDFNPIEFDGFRKQSGLNSFTHTARHWIEKTRITFPTFIMAGAHPLREVITHGYDAG